jgi:hypothetical protein
MPKCTVCTHPDSQAIDQDLLAGNGTLETLSQKYGPSPSALHRHKQHLQEKISQARQHLENNLRLGYLFKLNQTLAEVEIASAKAQAADNVDQVFKGARVKNRLLRDLSKMATPWDSQTIHRLMASPQWQSQDCLLPTDPAFLARGHKILADALFHPCPDPPPGRANAADKDAVPSVGPESLAFASLSPETLAALHPDLLESLLPALSPPNPATPLKRRRCVGRKRKPPPAVLPSSSITAPGLPEETPDSANSARNQREISAKKAPKSRSSKENIKLNQLDNSAKKSVAKKREISPSDAPHESPSATKNQKPETTTPDPGLRSPVPSPSFTQDSELRTQDCLSEPGLRSPVPGPSITQDSELRTQDCLSEPGLRSPVPGPSITQDSGLGTQNCLSSTTASGLPDEPPICAMPPRNQREISAKKAPKSRLSKLITKLKQLYSSSPKNALKKSQSPSGVALEVPLNPSSPVPSPLKSFFQKRQTAIDKRQTVFTGLSAWLRKLAAARRPEPPPVRIHADDYPIIRIATERYHPGAY